jgi:Dullard-like phosphatase family protein
MATKVDMYSSMSQGPGRFLQQRIQKIESRLDSTQQYTFIQDTLKQNLPMPMSISGIVGPKPRKPVNQAGFQIRLSKTPSMVKMKSEVLPSPTLKKEPLTPTIATSASTLRLTTNREFNSSQPPTKDYIVKGHNRVLSLGVGGESARKSLDLDKPTITLQNSSHMKAGSYFSVIKKEPASGESTPLLKMTPVKIGGRTQRDDDSPTIFQTHRGSNKYFSVIKPFSVDKLPDLGKPTDISSIWANIGFEPKARLPNYYMNHLRRALTKRDSNDPRDKAYLEHFKKSQKDLIQMGTDSLNDMEEFTDKARLRLLGKEAETSFHNDSPFQKPLLVLDLDETLIHCPKEETKGCDYTMLVPGTCTIISFNVRPYLEEFLEEVSKIFVVYVFTASDASYARTIVNFIDPQRKFISRIIDRRFCCASTKGYVVKDLRIFGKESKIRQILLVDNSHYCMLPQLRNGIPILPFYFSKSDRELLELKEYLKKLADLPNMVEANSEYFKLHLLMEKKSLDQIIDSLFE